MFGGESLVNLVNHQQFTKLISSKLVVITNNLLADLFIHQTFLPKSSSIHFCQTLSPPNLLKIFQSMYLHKITIKVILQQCQHKQIILPLCKNALGLHASNILGQ